MALFMAIGSAAKVVERFGEEPNDLSKLSQLRQMENVNRPIPDLFVPLALPHTWQCEDDAIDIVVHEDTQITLLGER